MSAQPLENREHLKYLENPFHFFYEIVRLNSQKWRLKMSMLQHSPKVRDAKVVFASLILAVVASGAGSASAAGINLSIPQAAPSVQALEAASVASLNYTLEAPAGIAPMMGPLGQAVSMSVPADGFAAATFIDQRGNVIIGFQLAVTSPAQQLAFDIVSGATPASRPGFADALVFTKAVVQMAAMQGVPASKVYVTGFSLGAMLASYVSMTTGLPGAVFGSSGLPGYQAPSVPAGNFISFVEAGDPVAQYGTDTSEAGSAVVTNPHMDHYGTVIGLGTQQDAQALLPFATEINGHSISQLQSGQFPISQAQLKQGEQQEADLQGRYHAMTVYGPDAEALAAQYGIH